MAAQVKQDQSEISDLRQTMIWIITKMIPFCLCVMIHLWLKFHEDLPCSSREKSPIVVNPEFDPIQNPDVDPDHHEIVIVFVSYHDMSLVKI